MTGIRINPALLTLAVLSFSVCSYAGFTSEYSVYTYNGHQYALTITGNQGGALTFQDAEAEAQSLGGHLVTINDSSENKWLTETFKNSYGNFEPNPWVNAVWTGLYYSGEGSIFDYANNWQWISGDDSTYRATITGPDTRSGDNWAMYLHGGNHPWPTTWNHNVLGSFLPQGIIEIAPIHNPAPGAVLLGGIGAGIVGWLRRRKSI